METEEKTMCTYDCKQCGKTYQDELYPTDPNDCCYCYDCRSSIVCPFCHEKEFDKSGLKGHLQYGCKIYARIETREVSNTSVKDATSEVQSPCNSSLSVLIASAAAHRACCGAEHDPKNGKLHGYCVVCGVPWPCETARRYL